MHFYERISLQFAFTFKLFLHAAVNGDRYLALLKDWFFPQIQNKPDIQEIHFQQDGATPHFALQVRDWLNNT